MIDTMTLMHGVCLGGVVDTHDARSMQSQASCFWDMLFGMANSAVVTYVCNFCCLYSIASFNTCNTIEVADKLCISGLQCLTVAVWEFIFFILLPLFE